MKIARVWSDKLGRHVWDYFGRRKRLVSKSDFQEQTGIPIPHSIKEFLFKGWIDEVTKNLPIISFSHQVEEVHLLTPIPDPSKIICLAFNYYDHARDAGLAPSDETSYFHKTQNRFE
jgi:2-keto-4-pentenoate hydratase/2-oxohepta-3-ene-1,7-dioic acid hydratase in catechol pathway